MRNKKGRREGEEGEGREEGSGKGDRTERKCVGEESISYRTDINEWSTLPRLFFFFSWWGGGLLC